MEEKMPLFNTMSFKAQREILAVGGPAFLRAPVSAQNWFIEFGFCAWGCGCFLTFHDQEDRLCIERRVARDEGLPPNCGRIYVFRRHIDRMVEKGLSDAAFTDEGDGYFSIVVRVDEDRRGASIGVSTDDESAPQ